MTWKVEDGESNCLEWSSGEHLSHGPLLARWECDISLKNTLDCLIICGFHFLSCTSKGSVSIYETKTFKIVTPENVVEATVTRLSFSPDGRYLLTAITDSTGHNIKIFNTTVWWTLLWKSLNQLIMCLSMVSFSHTFRPGKLLIPNLCNRQYH